MDNAEWEYLCKRRYEIRVRSLSNRIYQQERCRHFEMREGGFKVASLVAGSAVLANAADPLLVTIAACVIFAGTAASLVFGWSRKARDAASRADQWIALDREIEAAGERGFTEAQLDGWAGRCNAIEAGEPAMHAVLFERAYRLALKALGGSATTEGPIGFRWRPVVMLP